MISDYPEGYIEFLYHLLILFPIIPLSDICPWTSYGSETNEYLHIFASWREEHIAKSIALRVNCCLTCEWRARFMQNNTDMQFIVDQWVG